MELCNHPVTPGLRSKRVTFDQPSNTRMGLRPATNNNNFQNTPSLAPGKATATTTKSRRILGDISNSRVSFAPATTTKASATKKTVKKMTYFEDDGDVEPCLRRPVGDSAMAFKIQAVEDAVSYFSQPQRQQQQQAIPAVEIDEPNFDEFLILSDKPCEW